MNKFTEPSEWTDEKKKQLIGDHRLVHKLYKMCLDGKKVFHRKGKLAGKPMTKEWMEKSHKWITKNMIAVGYRHFMDDSLDRTLSLEFKEKSEHEHITIGDVLYDKKREIMEKITTDSGDSLIPKDMDEVKWAIYFTAPHGEMIWKGEKNLIVKTIEIKKHIDVPLLLVSGNHAYGIIKLHAPQMVTQEVFQKEKDNHKISKEESDRWGFNKKELYVYKFDLVYSFRKPKRVSKPKGLQNFTKVTKIRIPKIQKKIFDIDEILNLLIGDDIKLALSKMTGITKDSVKPVSRPQLTFLHLMLHRLYDQKSADEEQLRSWHLAVSSEMNNRGLKHYFKNKLDR